MRKLAEFLSDNLSYVFFVASAGWAAAFAPWGMRHRDLLEDFLVNNQLAPEMRWNLLILLVAGVLLALLLWCGLGRLAFATGRSVRLLLQRSATLALAVTLLAFLPILSLKTLPVEHPFLTFFFVAAMALIVFVVVNRAAQLFGPAPVRLHRLASGRTGLIVTCCLTAGYVIFMSLLAIARHNSFMTHSFDLGIHDQIVYNALHQGVLRSTQHGPQPINYLGNHFAPILFLVAPLYALNPDARTLLVLQSLFLGLGAIPVYLLARQKLRSTTLAIALGASYLLFPALHGINTFDFHQIALVTSLLLWALYCLEAGRTKLFLVFLVLAAATKEEVALTVAAFGTYLFLVKRRYLLGAALAIGGAAYFALVVGYVMPALGGVPQVYRFAGLMAGGSGGLSAVGTTLLTNPTYILVYIFGDPRKIEFLCLLLLPVLFLPLLAGRSLVLAVPAFSVALLASVEVNFSIGTQYPAIMVPFVSFLAIVGIQRLDARRFHRLALAAAILIASLAMNYEYGWLYGRLFNGFPRPTAHDRVVESFFSLVPSDATVSAASDLVPHLSDRETIYMFPTTEHADYILFDAHPKADFWPSTARDARQEMTRALAPYLASGEYGVARSDDWVLLLKRGMDAGKNPAALRLLFSTKIEAEDLSSDFTSPPAQDDHASGGKARIADGSLPHLEGRNAAIYGPYASLLPGRYRVSYRLKLDAPSLRKGRVATADVFSTAMGGALAGQEIVVGDFGAPGEYQDFSFDVEIRQALDDIEYRVLYDGPERIWVDAVDVTPLQTAIPVADIQGGDLAGRTLGLIPGRYRAVISLKAPETALTGPVASIEVFSLTAGGPLAAVDVDAAAFNSPGTQEDFAIEFETAQKWPDAEFRVIPRLDGAVVTERVQVWQLLQ